MYFLKYMLYKIYFARIMGVRFKSLNLKNLHPTGYIPTNSLV